MYLRSPSSLVLTTACAAVTSGTGFVIKVSGTVPTTISGAGSYVDVVGGPEPHVVRAADLSVSGLAGSNLTVSTDVTDAGIFTAGINQPPDYVCPAQQTCYPPIALQLWPALVRAVAASALEAQLDPGANNMRIRAEAAKRDAIAVMMPRDNRRSRAIVGNSPLRAARGVGWRRNGTP